MGDTEIFYTNKMDLNGICCRHSLNKNREGSHFTAWKGNIITQDTESLHMCMGVVVCLKQTKSRCPCCVTGLVHVSIHMLCIFYAAFVYCMLQNSLGFVRSQSQESTLSITYV